jgi:hypothetical protein
MLVYDIAARRSVHQLESAPSTTGSSTTGTGAWTLAAELKQWFGFDVPPLARRLGYTLALVLADVIIFQIIVCVATQHAVALLSIAYCASLI